MNCFWNSKFVQIDCTWQKNNNKISVGTHVNFTKFSFVAQNMAQRQMGPPINLKILVPATASGAIIGKGGETIAEIQKQTATRIKMSKATDFYPGTTERVGLIQGPAESIITVMDFIAEKVTEKPDPSAKPAIDFDNKLPAEREKQVKVIIPNSTAGMIIGKGGSFIKTVKDESGAFIQISQKSKDATLPERVVTIIGKLDTV